MYVVIAGAGLVGGMVARKLLENKHDVVVIDADKGICDRLYAETGVVTIVGNAAGIGVLTEAGIDKADCFVAATGADADNLASALLAKSFEVPRVIVRMRDPAYENAYRLAGVNSILRVTDLMVNQMMVEIEQPNIRKVSTIGGGKADIFTITVPPEGRVIGKSVEDIASSDAFPPECIFIAVFREAEGEFVIPRGQTEIQAGDQIFLISTGEDIKQASDVLMAHTR